jgi:hypothetical protein
MKKYLFLLLFFTGNKTFAQKAKDTLSDNLKEYHFRYYQLPGQPDSATFFKQQDSIYKQQQKLKQIQRKIDSLKLLPPSQKNLAYNAVSINSKATR